jgi:transcriptional regulator with GAF, ATPase, and Fis domain
MKCLVGWIQITPFPVNNEKGGGFAKGLVQHKYPREHIVNALRKGGSLDNAADILQISRATLWYHMDKFEIELKEWKGESSEKNT